MTADDFLSPSASQEISYYRDGGTLVLQDQASGHEVQTRLLTILILVGRDHSAATTAVDLILEHEGKQPADAI